MNCKLRGRVVQVCFKLFLTEYYQTSKKNTLNISDIVIETQRRTIATLHFVNKQKNSTEFHTYLFCVFVKQDIKEK